MGHNLSTTNVMANKANQLGRNTRWRSHYAGYLRRSAIQHMQNDKIKNRVFSFQFFITGSIFCFLIYFGLALGSGLSPKFTLFLILISLLGLGFIKNRFKKCRSYLLIIVLLTLTVLMFRIEVNYDFNQAKITGQKTAIAITDYKNRHGFYPKSIESLPEKKTQGTVAGFFITYELENDVPKLIVGRRDWKATWDWIDQKWN
jgi:hypothetical protein